jgi:hypothetical protein
MHLQRRNTNMMTDDEVRDFKLTKSEAESALWSRLSQWLIAKRQQVRESNDSTTLNIAETTAKRGEIRMASLILALADEAGQGPRQSELHTEPESAFFPPHGG